MKKMSFLAVSMFALVFGLSQLAYSQQIFFDNFDSGADPVWGNEIGDWSAHDGVYEASSPNNNPLTYSSVTTDTSLANFTVEVDVNDVDDGGIWLRSDYNGGSQDGVLLVIGGDRGTYDGLYWHIVQNGSSGPALNRGGVSGLQGNNVHLKVVVQGNNYLVLINGGTTPVTTLTDNTFTSGSVGLYDCSIFEPEDQSFDNFSISLNPPIPTVSEFAQAYGSISPDANYNILCDSEWDGDVDGSDLAQFAAEFELEI